MRLMLVLLLATPPPSSERRGNPLRPLMPWLRFPLRPPLAHSHFPSPFTTTTTTTTTLPPPPPPPPLHPAPIFFFPFPQCVCVLPQCSVGGEGCTQLLPPKAKRLESFKQEKPTTRSRRRNQPKIPSNKWQKVATGLRLDDALIPSINR